MVRTFVAVLIALPTSALADESRSTPVVNGFDYTYGHASVVDPPMDVLLGDAERLRAWVRANRGPLIAPIENVPSMTPLRVKDDGWKAASPEYDLLKVTAEYAADHPLNGHNIGALVARPTAVDPRKPLIIALHGHEIGHRGDPPVKLWEENWWPTKLARAGYVVITPSHLPYTQLGSLYVDHDYHAVWTRLVWDLVTATLNAPSAIPPYEGMAVAGLSSGGTTGALLLAWRPEVRQGVLAGSLLPLEFLRQNYRWTGQPNSWDLRNVYSYLPYYLLFADQRVQWQMGKKDDFFPGTGPIAPAPAFPGTDRDVMTSEPLGDFLSMREAASKLGGHAELFIHDEGHVFRASAAVRFLSQQ